MDPRPAGARAWRLKPELARAGGPPPGHGRCSFAMRRGSPARNTLAYFLIFNAPLRHDPARSVAVALNITTVETVSRWLCRRVPLPGEAILRGESGELPRWQQTRQSDRRRYVSLRTATLIPRSDLQSNHGVAASMQRELNCAAGTGDILSPRTNGRAPDTPLGRSCRGAGRTRAASAPAGRGSRRCASSR